MNPFDPLNVLLIANVILAMAAVSHRRQMRVPVLIALWLTGAAALLAAGFAGYVLFIQQESALLGGLVTVGLAGVLFAEFLCLLAVYLWRVRGTHPITTPSL